jgi:hypothetical protein
MNNLDAIKQRLKDAGFSSFEDWSFDFIKHGGKTINYYAKAESESGQIREKGFFIDPIENPELGLDGKNPEDVMDVFRKILLDNFTEFVG